MRHCDNCGGSCDYLGALGSVHWFRCEDCGLDQGQTENGVPEPELDDWVPGWSDWYDEVGNISSS